MTNRMRLLFIPFAQLRAILDRAGYHFPEHATITVSMLGISITWEPREETNKAPKWHRQQ